MQAQEARKCRIYRQLKNHGTGKCRVRHVDVSIGGTNEANTGMDMLPLEARVSTLCMYKSAVAEACVRMLG